jgi:raffinose/stachyose/melibiose transport system permease protein
LSIAEPPLAPGRAAARPGAAPSRRRGHRNLRRRLELLVLIGPALAFYLLFVLFPVVQALHYSLYNWTGLGSLTDYIGLDNYRRAWDDDAFRGAIRHNGLLVLLTIVVQLPIALGVALMLNRPLRGRSLLRLIFFAPYVLSEAITAVIWLLMLQPDGLVDQTMRSVGLGSLVQLWLADVSIVGLTMFIVITWKYLGFGIILLLAGLQGIPRELTEAAAIDGAGPVSTLRYVTLPLLGPTIRIWGFLSIIGALQLFDIVWLITGGGPADASNTMAVYMIDRGFRRYDFGYGSAVAVILFVISFAFSLLYQRFVLRRDTEGALTGMVQ